MNFFCRIGGASSIPEPEFNGSRWSVFSCCQFKQLYKTSQHWCWC